MSNADPNLEDEAAPQPAPTSPAQAAASVVIAAAPNLARRAPELVTVVILAGLFLWAQDRALGRLGDTMDRLSSELAGVRQAIYEIDLAPAQRPGEDGP